MFLLHKNIFHICKTGQIYKNDSNLISNGKYMNVFLIFYSRDSSETGTNLKIVEQIIIYDNTSLKAFVCLVLVIFRNQNFSLCIAFLIIILMFYFL